jgi:hypothetical protein
MPLHEGDVEILSISSRDKPRPGGGFERVREITIRVRGMVKQVVIIPESQFTPQWADQLILATAADLVDLLEKYPVQGA